MSFHGRGERPGESADVLRKWASLFKPVTVAWDPLGSMVRVAEAQAQRLEVRLNELIKNSDAELQKSSLCEPLRADAGLNRWLRKEREEAYSDWLEWILEQLQKLPGEASNVISVLGITEPGVIPIAKSSKFKIAREYRIPDGSRLDLLLTIEKSVMLIIEVKKYSAETADTKKQKGYYEWLKERNFTHQIALLLAPDAAEEKYEGFSRLLWADLCIRLRWLLLQPGVQIDPVKSAMFVAFIGAVETNLLGFVAPPEHPGDSEDDVERLFYRKTVDYLDKYLRGSAL
jgi:PD-(D/E)XK nuclease superfamily